MTERSLQGFVSGRVQGVGFRYFMRRQAEAEGLRGYARNLADGRVEFLLQGDARAIDRVLARVRLGPPHAEVRGVELLDASDSPAVSGFITR